MLDYLYLDDGNAPSGRGNGVARGRTLGRSACVGLLARHLGVVPDPANFWIASTDGLGRRIRPLVLHFGRPVPYDVSISHGDGVAVAALTQIAHRVGVDVTPVSGVSAKFLLPWLTAAERARVAGDGGETDRGTLAALWAGKEASYKALNRGEAFDPARIEVVRLGEHAWEGRFAGRCCALGFLSRRDHVVGIARWVPSGGSNAP